MMMTDSGRSRVMICSSYVTTRSLSSVPGSSLVVAPAAMTQWSKVTVCSPPGPSTRRVWSSVKVPRPSSSVILFFFIR